MGDADPEARAAVLAPERDPQPSQLPSPNAARRRRHGAPEEDDDDLGSLTAGLELDDAPRGRHGASSGGLSAAELIARVRADTLTTAAAAGSVPAPVRDVPKSRTGRNLPAAIAVGLALAGTIVVALFAYRPSFVVVLCAAVGLGIFEMVQGVAKLEARAPLVPLWVGGAAMEIAAWKRGPDGLVGALLLTAVGVLVWRLADGAIGYRQDAAAGVLIGLYVPFLAGFAVLLAHPPDGAARVVIFIAAVVCSDTGGYTAGVLFGKHPMAPTVSPKKSWEGFTGSVIGSAIAGALIMDLTFHQQWWKGLVFGVAIAVVATIGDLGESMIKRDLALKDMGKILPGHGGIMDRLDSLLPCAPIAYLLLSVFLTT